MAVGPKMMTVAGLMTGLAVIHHAAGKRLI
jgi:hypothetical protein